MMGTTISTAHQGLSPVRDSALAAGITVVKAARTISQCQIDNAPTHDLRLNDPFRSGMNPAAFILKLGHRTAESRTYRELADLSPNQTRAQSMLGPDLQLYHFTPDDVGRLLSVPASATAPHMIDDRTRRR